MFVINILIFVIASLFFVNYFFTFAFDMHLSAYHVWGVLLEYVINRDEQNQL